jgi:hypothetical protein
MAPRMRSASLGGGMRLGKRIGWLHSLLMSAYGSHARPSE